MARKDDFCFSWQLAGSAFVGCPLRHGETVRLRWAASGRSSDSAVLWLHYSYELRIAMGEGKLAVVSAEANSECASAVGFKMCYPLTPWNKTIFNCLVLQWKPTAASTDLRMMSADGPKCHLHLCCCRDISLFSSPPFPSPPPTHTLRTTVFPTIPRLLGIV